MTKSKGSKRRTSSDSAIVMAYLDNAKALKRFIARLLGSQTDAEDLMQKAFLRAYCAEEKHPLDQPKSYLFKVSKNLVLDELRTRSRKPTDYLNDLGGAAELLDEASPEDCAIAHQRLALHCEAVSTLPPACRKVYLLRKVYGLSYKDIAVRLGVSTRTVEAQLAKGFALCQRYIEERDQQSTQTKHVSTRRVDDGR